MRRYRLFLPLFCLLFVFALPLPVSAAPDQPDLHYPFEDTGLNNGGQLWSFVFEYVVNADSYNLDVDGLLTADLIHIDGLTPSSGLNCWGVPGDGGCEYILTDEQRALLIDDTYTWSVTAVNGDGNTPSEVRTFYVNVEMPEYYGGWYPVGGKLVHSGYELWAFNFAYLTAAESFSLELRDPTDTVIINESSLTPAEDSDQLTCFIQSGSCDYVPTDAQRDQITGVEGWYHWSVVATTPSWSMRFTPNYEAFKIDYDGLAVGPWEFLWPVWGQTFVDATDINPIIWRASGNATYYELDFSRWYPAVESLFYYAVLTPQSDADQLTCTAQICKFTLTTEQLAQLNDGETFAISANAINADDAINNGVGDFKINSNAVLPGMFYAINPLGNKVFKDNPPAKTYMWTESSNAIGYDFSVYLFHTRWTEWLIGMNLTPSADNDPLLCQLGTCVLTLPAKELSALQQGGHFEWRVRAWNADGITLPNGRDWGYRFTIDPGKQDILKNGGFETASASGIPTSWTRTSATPSNDKIACDAAGVHVAFEGLCVLQLRGSSTENVVFTQNIPGTSLLRGLRWAELEPMLTLRGYYKATGTPNLTITALVTYANGAGTEKIVLKVNKAAPKYHAIPGTNTIELGEDIAKVKVTLNHRSLKGIIYLDGLSLVLSSSNISRSSEWIPLPPAP